MLLTSEICEAILRDHFRKPRFAVKCEDGTAEMIENRSCGDQIQISLKMDIDESLPVRGCFEGAGCAASQAGASLMVSYVNSLTRADAKVGLERFCRLMENDGTDPSEYFEEYGEVAALFIFAGKPSRVQCATLAAQLLLRMLNT